MQIGCYIVQPADPSCLANIIQHTDSIPSHIAASQPLTYLDLSSTILLRRLSLRPDIRLLHFDSHLPLQIRPSITPGNSRLLFPDYLHGEHSPWIRAGRRMFACTVSSRHLGAPTALNPAALPIWIHHPALHPIPPLLQHQALRSTLRPCTVEIHASNSSRPLTSRHIAVVFVLGCHTRSDKPSAIISFQSIPRQLQFEPLCSPTEGAHAINITVITQLSLKQFITVQWSLRPGSRRAAKLQQLLRPDPELETPHDFKLPLTQLLLHLTHIYVDVYSSHDLLQCCLYSPHQPWEATKKGLGRFLYSTTRIVTLYYQKYTGRRCGVGYGCLGEEGCMCTHYVSVLVIRRKRVWQEGRQMGPAPSPQGQGPGRECKRKA